MPTSLRFESIDPNPEGSFLLRYHNELSLPDIYNWHYHPEFEIASIPRGNGQRFIGGSVTQFTDGDLVLIGPNTPHNTFRVGYTSTNYEQYCLQFDKKLVSDISKNASEFQPLVKLLEDAHTGIFFENVHFKNEICLKLQALLHLNGLSRLLGFYEVLGLMAKEPYCKINVQETKIAGDLQHIERVRKMYKIIEQQITSTLKSAEVAAQLGLTPSSFCRFLNQHTGKTFKTILTEVRLQEACKLLLNEEYTIQQIAGLSGFNTVSYFNKCFRSQLLCTPRAFRERHKPVGVIS